MSKNMDIENQISAVKNAIRLIEFFDFEGDDSSTNQTIKDLRQLQKQLESDMEVYKELDKLMESGDIGKINLFD